jgi:hypothetical protein
VSGLIKKFEGGEYCESLPWEIQYDPIDVIIGHKFGANPPQMKPVCKHMVPLRTDLLTRYDGIVLETYYGSLRAVVRASNEGGCNSTEVCLDCILENA